MNARVTLSVTLLLTVAPVLALGQASVAWLQPQRGTSIAVDAASNVYTLDYEQSLGAEMILTKRDADGVLLWTASYDQPDATKWERSSWVSSDAAGNAIVCGTLMSGYSSPVQAASIVMKFDPTGQLLWRRVYESDFDGSYLKKCLVDADGNVYALGMGAGPSGHVTKVKKLSPAGAALWSYFDQDGIGAPVNFKLTPDAKLVIAARSRTGSFNGYAKIDLDGNKLWSYPAVQSPTTGDVAGDARGNSYLLAGEPAPGGGTLVRKLSATGTLLWERAYPLAGFRVEVGGDNQALASGFPDANTPGAAFLKIGQDSTPLWSNLDADGPLRLLLHAQLELDSAGNAYLAAGTLFEMAVCRVDADGRSAWTVTLPGSYANGIALGPGASSVFVVGGATARIDNPQSAAPAGPLRVARSGETLQIAWEPAAGATDYDLIRGELAEFRPLPTRLDLGRVSCVAAGSTATEATDRPPAAPAPGSVQFWLVRANGHAGKGSYGRTAQGLEALPSAGDCP